MKALIVDDDISTVNSIYRYMQWEELGIGQVFKAYAAQGAKEIILKERPEIIVCDIEMPMGSGLDLLRWDRERQFGSQFLFLTCHSSFEFAAEAIQHQAAEYILKPFDPVRLTEALQTAVERISHRQRLYRDSTLWKDNRRAVEREFWKDVLFRRIPADGSAIVEEASKRGVELPEKDCADMALISAAAKEYQVAEEGKPAEQALILLMEEQMGGSFPTVFYRNEANVLVGVHIADSGGGLRERCRELLKVSEKSFPGYELTCYVAEGIPLEEMGDIRQQMERRDLNNISSRGRVIWWKQTMPQERAAAPLDLTALYPLLLGGERMKIMKMLQRQIEEAAAQAEATPDILYTIQQDIVQEAYVYLHKNGIRPALLFGDKISIQMMRGASSSRYAMIKWISYFFNRLIDFDEKRKESESIVAQARRYIESNYQENISRNEVAGSVFLTPEYLARIFKKETGMSINTYIAECRLERAKVLLSDTQMSVSQVAVEVGFNGLPYFISSFRKKFGTAPGEYRRGREGTEKRAPHF